MPATYLGSYTVGGAVPGLHAVFSQLQGSLDGLRRDVALRVQELTAANLALSAASASVPGLKSAIRIPAIGDLEAQLDASLSLQLSLTAQLADPVSFIAARLSAVQSVSINLAAAAPALVIGAQLGASIAAVATLEGKIATIDAALGGLDGLTTAIAAQVNAISGIQSALSLAIAQIAGALTAALVMQSQLQKAGAHCLLYTGPLSGLGAAIDGATGGTGLGGGTDVRVPVVLADSSDSFLVDAINSVFRTSI